MKLVEALASLVVDLEGALVRIGRGDVADQLREVEIESWAYDDFADAAYVHVTGSRAPDHRPPGMAADDEIVSVYDELGVNVELDRARRVRRIEILQPGEMVARLQDLGLPARPPDTP